MKLNYQIFGEGRPIIVLHGLFGSARNWQGIAKIMAKEFQVIAVDLRNHGQSPHLDGMTYAEMANDIQLLIDSLRIKHPVVIGHSMGGKVAMTMALSTKDLLSGLIIVDIAPVTYQHDFSQYIKAMQALPLEKITSRQIAEQTLLKSINSKTLTAFVMQNLVRTQNGFKWRINLSEIAKYLTDIIGFPDNLPLSKNRVPSLFIGGANSDYIDVIDGKIQ